jgi:hypothetical protein
MNAFPGVVDTHGVPHVDPQFIRDYRRTLKSLRNQRVSFVVKPRTRSEEANAYLWSVVYKLMAEDQQVTPEDIHDAMCERFLPNERKRVEFFNKLTGECLAVEADARRSSKLTGGEFYDFVERVRQFAAEFLGVVTPDPDPLYWRKRTTKGKES